MIRMVLLTFKICAGQGFSEKEGPYCIVCFLEKYELLYYENDRYSFREKSYAGYFAAFDRAVRL